VGGLVGVDCSGTRSHAANDMNQMPITFSLQKAAEELLFGGSKDGSGARLNDKVLELDEVSSHGSGGYRRRGREPNGCSACRVPRSRALVVETGARPCRGPLLVGAYCSWPRRGQWCPCLAAGPGPRSEEARLDPCLMESGTLRCVYHHPVIWPLKRAFGVYNFC
jgi:hypothetical protein